MLTQDDVHPLPKQHVPDSTDWLQTLVNLAIASRTFGFANAGGYVQPWSMLYEQRRV